MVHPARSLVGEQIGKYHVLGLLGQGAQGAVYLAEDPQLRRQVAIKVFPAQVAVDPELLGRFFDEARAAAQINHPGIVHIYDCGTDVGTGHSYIVMEYVQGETLHARLAREERLPVREAVQILLRLAEALEAAHSACDERGLPAPIVHRDLKPENIFLVAEPAGVKVVDFGVAKLAPQLRSAATLPGMFAFGSPPYMAPEQCNEGQPVDHRADLYALGCLAYEMLTGTPPFGRENLPHLLASHQYATPAPIGERVAVPSELEAIVGKLLEKDPADRFRSCAELCRALTRIDRAAPKMAQRPTSSRARSHRAERQGVLQAAWLLKMSPAAAWGVGFVLGFALLGLSISLGVGNSYCRSVNWGPNYIAVIPFMFAAMLRALQAGDEALAALSPQGMLLDARGRPLNANPARAAWRERLRWFNGLAPAIALGCVAVSIGEWRTRVQQEPISGEWWTESPTVGLAGAALQGIAIGVVITAAILIVYFTWLVTELSRSREGIVLVASPRSQDGRRGFEVFEDCLEAVLVSAGLLYAALWASNVQHIALEYGRQLNSTVGFGDLMLQWPIFDTGPGHYSSNMTVIAASMIAVVVWVVVYGLHRVYWQAATKPVVARAELPPLLSYASLPRLMLVLLAGVGCFAVYHLGLFFILGMAAAVLVRARRALGSKVAADRTHSS